MGKFQFLKESMATLGFLVLSAGWKLTIAVRPVSSLGTNGKAITTTWWTTRMTAREGQSS